MLHMASQITWAHKKYSEENQSKLMEEMGLLGCNFTNIFFFPLTI